MLIYNYDLIIMIFFTIVIPLNKLKSRQILAKHQMHTNNRFRERESTTYLEMNRQEENIMCDDR